MVNHRTESLPQLSWNAVQARRLERQGLLAAWEDAETTDVVAAMCGAHAQVMSAAEMSVALRLAGATRTDIRKALWEEHSLVKTFGPRGTVHLLPARDLGLWLGALSALPPSRNDLPEEAQMTAEQTDTVVEAIAGILADGEMIVDEMDEAVVDAVGAWAGDLVAPMWYEVLPRWRPAIYAAASRGVLCYGPKRGRKVTYTNPRRWLPDLAPAGGQAALRALVVRYLHAYGPATPQQFARWLAMPAGLATAIFEAMDSELAQVTVEGSVAWVNAGDDEAPETPAAGIRLMPYFDAFVVGSHPRDLLFPGDAAERALANGQAGNFPVLLVDGVVAGVWHQRRSGRTIQVTVEPLVELQGGRRRELEQQVERMAEILEGNPALTIGNVVVGPHA